MGIDELCSIFHGSSARSQWPRNLTFRLPTAPNPARSGLGRRARQPPRTAKNGKCRRFGPPNPFESRYESSLNGSTAPWERHGACRFALKTTRIPVVLEKMAMPLQISTWAPRRGPATARTAGARHLATSTGLRALITASWSCRGLQSASGPRSELELGAPPGALLPVLGQKIV